jgi:YqaJ-like viral recombinase domain
MDEILKRRRRNFIGGSEARIIMGTDEAALLRLWQEKRGEAEPEDLSGNLIVQLGKVTEDLNRHWFETTAGQAVIDVQKHVRHPALRWMGATLDGRVEASGAVFEAKFMLPWSFSEEAAVEKYGPQLQHNMCVVAARSAVLSVITGGGKWVEIATHADPLYQHLIVTAERKFWRCVESGEPPALFGVDPPKPRIKAVRIGFLLLVQLGVIPAKVENCGHHHIVKARIELILFQMRLFRASQEGAMIGTSRGIPTGLSEFQVLRLFKCAVKDDDTLVDAIVERLYFAMKDHDPTRAEDAVGLIVDRDAAAGSKFGELLDDLWPRRPASRVAA